MDPAQASISTSPELKNTYLEQLSQIKYLRYDLNSKKLVEASWLRFIFEKFKGFFGFLDTTDENFLADKIFVYLDKRKEKFYEQDIQNIQKLCKHAGVSVDEENQTKSINQKKLTELVEIIFSRISKTTSFEKQKLLEGRISIAETVAQAKTHKIVIESPQSGPAFETPLPQLFTFHNSDEESGVDYGSDMDRGDTTREEDQPNEELQIQGIEPKPANTGQQIFETEESGESEDLIQIPDVQSSDEESFEVNKPVPSNDEVASLEILFSSDAVYTEEIPPTTTWEKVQKYALPVIGLIGIVGLGVIGLGVGMQMNTLVGNSEVTNYQSHNKTQPRLAFSNSYVSHAEFSNRMKRLNAVKINKIKANPINYSFPAIAPTIAEQSFKAYLNSTPILLDKKVLLHVVGDLFGDPALEGSSSQRMMEYFLNILHAKIDSLKICNTETQNIFCRQFGGPSFNELEKKLMLAKMLYEQFHTQDTFQFSAVLTDQFIQLKPNESFFFPGGWHRHAVVYEIVKQSDATIIFRAYNTGEGNEVHSNAIIGTKKVSVPFIERKNVETAIFFSPDIILSLQELVREQISNNPKLSSYDFTHRVLEAMGGENSGKEYGLEMMHPSQQSGTCAYMSLLAAFTQNLKDQKRARRFAFESEIKALRDYDSAFYRDYAQDKQAYNLMQKGKAAFAVRVVNDWYTKRVILPEELPIVLNEISRIEAHLEEAKRMIEEEIIKNAATLSLAPRLDGISFPKVSAELMKMDKTSLSFKEFKGIDLSFPDIRSLHIEPKTVLKDVGKIRETIVKAIYLDRFAEAREMIKQVVVKLPFHDPEFWKNIDRTRATEFVQLYADLGQDLIKTILIGGSKNNINTGFLKPSDYLALLKLLHGADQTLQECQSILGFSFPSIYQDIMDIYFYNRAVVFPLTEAEWQEEFNRERNYWIEHDRKTTINGDFFGLNSINSRFLPVTERLYREDVPEIDWALKWLIEHPQLQEELQKEDPSLEQSDILIKAVALIRTLKRNGTIHKEQQKLPKEFYLLRRLSYHVNFVVSGTMSPAKKAFWDFDAEGNSLKDIIEGNGLEIFIKGGEFGLTWSSFFDYFQIESKFDRSSKGEKDFEWNFRESIGQFSHTGISSHLFWKGWQDYVNAPARIRIEPNEIALKEGNEFHRQHQKQILALGSKTTLQIDETLGFFNRYISRLNQLDYQNTFEFRMFDAGLLLREFKIPHDSQILTERLSEFCRRGFNLNVIKKDYSTAFFFLRMNTRLATMVNHHIIEYPNLFPTNFKSTFADSKIWINELLAFKGLSSSLEIDLLQEQLMVYRNQPILTAEDWVIFISYGIKLNLLEPHSKKSEKSIHTEAKDSLVYRHYDLQALEKNPNRDRIFNEVVKRTNQQNIDYEWEVKYPYAKSKNGKYTINLSKGELYQDQGAPLKKIPEVISQDPVFINLFGQQNHWSGNEINPNCFEFTDKKGNLYQVSRLPENNQLNFKLQFKQSWYVRTSEIASKFGFSTLSQGKDQWYSPLDRSFILTHKGTPLYLIDDLSTSFKIEELNENMEKTGRIVSFDSDDALDRTLNRFEDRSNTIILLDTNNGQPLAVQFPRYGLTFTAKQSSKTEEWELYSDQYKGLKLSKTQILSALREHSNYLVLEKDLMGGIEKKILLPLTTFTPPSSTLSIDDQRAGVFKNNYHTYLVDLDPKTGRLNPKEDLVRLHLAMRYLWKQEYAEANSYLKEFNAHDHTFSQVEVDMLEMIVNLDNKDQHPNALALRLRAEALLLKNEKDFPDSNLSYKHCELNFNYIKMRIKNFEHYLENLEHVKEYRLAVEEEILYLNSLPSMQIPRLQNRWNSIAPLSYNLLESVQKNLLISPRDEFVHLTIPGLIIKEPFKRKEAYPWFRALQDVYEKNNPANGSVLKNSLLSNFLLIYDTLQKGDRASNEELRLMIFHVTGLKKEVESFDRTQLLNALDRILRVKIRSENEEESLTAYIFYTMRNYPDKFNIGVTNLWDSKNGFNYLNCSEIFYIAVKINPLDLPSHYTYQFSSQEATALSWKEPPGVCIILPDIAPFGSQPVIPRIQDYFEKILPEGQQQNDLSQSIIPKSIQAIISKIQDFFAKKTMVQANTVSQRCKDLQQTVFSKPIQDGFVKSKFKQISEKLGLYAEKMQTRERINYSLKDVQQISSLKNKLINEKISRNNELAFLKEQIESLLNRPFEDQEQQNIKELRISGQVESLITIEEAVVLFLRQDTYRFQLRNPALSVDEAINAILLIRGFLERATYNQQLHRMIEGIDKVLSLKAANHDEIELQEAINDLVQLSTQRRIYSTAHHPEYLLFEYQQGVLLRNAQVELLDKLKIKNGKVGAPEYLGVVGEAIPGMGKTFAVLPIQSLLNANGEQLSINMIPESLIDSMNPQVRKTLKTTAETYLERIDINRQIAITPDNLKIFYARISRIRDEGRVLSIKPSSGYNLFLKFIEQFEQSVNKQNLSSIENDSIEIYSNILTLFKKSGALIIDEIDTVLDLMMSFHYITGEKQSLEEMYHDTAASTLLFLATNEAVEKKTNLGFGRHESKEGFTEKYYHEEIKPLLVNALLNNQFDDIDLELQTFLKGLDSTFFKSLFREKKVMNDFLNGKNIQAGRDFLSSQTESIQDRMALYYAQFNEFLPLILSKKLKQDYGSDPENLLSEIPIPYRQSKASLGSTFGTDLETILFTIKEKLQVGIGYATIEKELERILVLVIKYLETHPSSEVKDVAFYQEYLDLVGGKDTFNIFNLSREDIEQIRQLINQNPRLQMRLIKRHILPHITVYSSQLNAQSSVFGLLFKSIQGMSGTLWNAKTFTRLIEKMYESETTQEILQLVWREKGSVKQIVQSKEVFIGSAGIKEILNQVYSRSDSKQGSFVDTAGLFRTVADRADVAKEMLLLKCWESTPIKGVIFYDSHNTIKVMKLINEVPTAVDLEQSGLTREEVVAFWDQEHTTGSDLKVGIHSTATMAIGKDTIFRDLEQSALRMRGLSENQRLNFIIADEDALIIRSSLKESLPDFDENQELTLEHLLFYTISKQARQQAKENFLSLNQEMEMILLEKAYSVLIDPKVSIEEKISVYKDTRSLFSDSTRVRPFHLYAQSTETKDKQAIVQLEKEKFLISPAMKAFQSNPLLSSQFPQEAIHKELDELIKASMPSLADEITITSTSGGKERVIQVTKQKEVAKETAKEAEKETEKEKMKMTEQKSPSTPFHWLKDKFFTVDYFNSIAYNRIVDPVSKIIQINKFPGADLIDTNLLVTKNFFLSYNKEDKPFGEFEKLLESILAIQDKKTKQWKVILLDQNDAAQVKEFLAQDALNPDPNENREVIIAQYHLKARTQHSGSEIIPHEAFEKDLELMRLLIQAKFLSGEVFYNESELPLLREWLKKDSKEAYQLFDKYILQFKEESRVQYSGSKLEELFNELNSAQ